MFLNDRSEHVKKRIIEDDHFDMARTRKCAECASDEEMTGLALHPSLDSMTVKQYFCSLEYKDIKTLELY